MAKSLSILATVAENCAMLTLKSTSHSRKKRKLTSASLNAYMNM